MKKQIAFFAYLLNFAIYGQAPLMNDDPGAISVTLPTTGLPAAPDTYEHKVFNIFYHIVADNNGNPVGNFGEAEIMENVKNLNVAFNPFQIYFKYRGHDTISNSSMLNIRTDTSPQINLSTITDLYNYSINYGHQHNVSINIFIVDNMYQDPASLTGEVLPGYRFGFLNPNNGSWVPNIFVMENYFQQVTVHEMGHVFGLKHTNLNGAISNTVTNACENVTRDFNDIHFNADDNGDELVDTPAAPLIYDVNDVNSLGVYIGSQVDDAGVPYANEIVPIANYMNINRLEHIHFQKEFTLQQGAYMRFFYDLFSSGFLSFETDVFSLYQPFERGTVTGNVISVTDHKDGTSTVCRALYDANFRFQKGFTYTFPDVPQTATINEIPLVNNPPFNCPVIISQLGLDENGNPLVGQAVTLDRGTICTVENFQSGIVYSTQVLGSMNITVEYLNEVQVKDPNLYDQLLSEYYYILKKMTESGAIHEETFYKQ